MADYLTRSDSLCYDVSINDIGASPDAPLARKGDVDMAECKNCQGPLRSHNKTGYCRTSEGCRVLGDRAAKRASYQRKNEPARCKGCERPIRSDNKTGYCTETELCRSNHNSAKHRSRYVPVKEDKAGWQKNYGVMHPDSVMWTSAKSRAVKRNIGFAITREDIRKVWTDTCPVFGYELRSNHTGTREHARESFSLDRIDNRLGYVPGNIQILSQRANAMKNDATPDELLRFAAWIQETYGAKGGGMGNG